MTEATAVYEPSVNGTPDAPSVTGGKRIPRREGWVDLPAEYEGLRVKVWINFPQRLANEVASGDNDRMVEALGKIVLEHDGWADDEGQPLPPPSTRMFWDSIPTELAAVIITLVQQEASRLPNSMLARRPR